MYALKYASNFAAQNDLAMIANGGPYAEKTDPSGTIWIFFPTGMVHDESVIEPLTQYGFQIQTSPKR